MINYLRHMAIFAKVVDEGSFRAAATALNLAPSRISQTISDLEQFLGVTLFYRTTRKLVVTNEGKNFYIHVANMTRNAELGINELNTSKTELIGELHISLPAFLAASSISTHIAQFAKEHPKVSLALNYTDQKIDLLNNGLDMCIRAGWLKDSSMMSRKLGESRRILVSSKAYAETRPTPKHPSDLKDWDWIHFTMRSHTIEFESKQGEKVSITENSNININSASALKHFLSQDLGLTLLPEHLVSEGLSSGKIIHILPDWMIKPLGLYAVWPDKSRRENLTLQLVRYLAEQEIITSKQ